MGNPPQVPDLKGMNKFEFEPGGGKPPTGLDANTAPGATGLPRSPQGVRSHDERLKTVTLQIERKAFVFTLMENERGQFLRITEGVVGRRNHIIIPSTGLADFGRMVAAMDAVPAQRQA